MSTFFCVLFALQSLLAQDHWRLVHTDGSVESVWGTLRLTAEEQARVQYGWAWSEIQPPRKVEPAKIGREKKAQTRAGRLHVQVVWPRGTRPPVGARIVAAPFGMWLDVPETHLPSWPVPAGGRLTIPVDPGQRWRLRLVAPTDGSWWVDVPPGRRAVLLAPVPARGLQVQVIDAAGKPLGAVNASLLEGSARQGMNRFWAALRAEDGRLGLAGLPDQEEVTLSVMKPGYAPAILRGRPSDLPERVRLTIGAVLTGTVVDEAGRPVAGAEVETESYASPQTPQLFRSMIRSTADGSFRLVGVTPGTVFVAARAQGFAPFGRQVEAAAEGTDLGRIVLQKGASLRVLAVDDLGAPVPGARVEAGPRLAATADGRGVALLTSVPPTAPVKVTARARGHRPGKAESNPPLPETLRVELQRAFTLVGRFVEAPGTPAAAGSLRTEQASCQTEAPLETDGRFEVDLQPGEEVTLVLRSPSARELRLPVPAGEAGEVRDLGDLSPPPSLTLVGRVVRDRDGAPVPGARIWLPRPGPEGPAMSWAARDLLATSAGEDGSFRLGGLAPGMADIRVDAPGFARANLPLMIPGDEQQGDVDLNEVRLTEGTLLRVVMADEESPGENAVARADLRNQWLEPDMLTAPVVDGEATFRNVPPGKVTVSVLAGRKLLCERLVEIPFETAGEMEVDCRRAALTVAGVVRVGGAPAGPGVLLWQPPALPTGSRIDNVVSPGGLRQQTIFGAGRPQVDVPVGPDGRFLTHDLTPGRWQVSWAPQAGSLSGAQTVEVPQRERYETVLTFAGRGVTGRVVDEDGHPVEGARVRDLEQGGALAFSAADGSFSLTGLSGERAVLEARKDELTSPATEVELAGDRTPEPVELVLGTRSAPKLEVRVAGATGEPVGGALVFLEEEGKGIRILTTAADGRAAAGLQPPLPARVRAAATTGAAWALGRWGSWKEVSRDGLTLTVGTPGMLVVESEEQSGAPSVVSAEGWDLTHLLRMTGNGPQVAPGQPLHLGGLPAGTYTVALDGVSVTSSVREGEPGMARFE